METGDGTRYDQQLKQAKMLMASLEQSILTSLQDEDFQQMTAEKFEAYDQAPATLAISRLLLAFHWFFALGTSTADNGHLKAGESVL